jgi:hypothetical protein
MAICSIALLSGCGGTLHNVSGTVSYDKTPVPDGEILFRPKDGSAPQASRIKDGKYVVSVPPGHYSIEIRASKKMPLPAGTTGALGETEVPQEYIGKKYNANTVLSEVIAGPKTVNFDLTAP